MPRLKSILRLPSLAFTAFTLWVLSLLPARAQVGSEIIEKLTQAGAGAGLGNTVSVSLPVLIGSIIRVALTILGIIFLILIVYAGFVWILARGREEEIQKAQKIIETSVIGLIVIILAYAISNFVFTIVITGSGV